MELVVLSRTPGVPDAVGKISVLFTYLSFHKKYMNVLDPLAMSEIDRVVWVSKFGTCDDHL